MVVDPFVLMVSATSIKSREEALALITRLKSWDIEFTRNGKGYALSEFALIEMRRLGIGPTRENLADLLKEHNIKEYSVNDLSPTCDGILVNAERIESLFFEYFEEIEFIKGTDVVIPDEIRARLPETVAIEFIEALCITAYAAQVHADTILDRDWSIVTTPLVTSMEVSLMTTQSQINTLDYNAVIISQKIERNWPLFYDPEHIYSEKDLFEAFMQGDLYLAIEIARCKIKKKENGLAIGKIDYSKIKFRKEFISSLKTSAMIKRASFREEVEKIFEAIAYCLSGHYSFGSDRHHPLREVVDKNSEQRLRRRRNSEGKLIVDKANRIQVVNTIHPLRIHYWHSDDGVCEFSNVTDKHDDNKIYIDSDQQIVH